MSDMSASDYALLSNGNGWNNGMWNNPFMYFVWLALLGGGRCGGGLFGGGNCGNGGLAEGQVLQAIDADSSRLQKSISDGFSFQDNLNAIHQNYNSIRDTQDTINRDTQGLLRQMCDNTQSINGTTVATGSSIKDSVMGGIGRLSQDVNYNSDRVRDAVGYSVSNLKDANWNNFDRTRGEMVAGFANLKDSNWNNFDRTRGEMACGFSNLKDTVNCNNEKNREIMAYNHSDLKNDLNYNFDRSRDVVGAGFAGIKDSLCCGFNGVDRGIADLGYKTQMNTCEIDRNIDRLRYDNSENTCKITKAIHEEGEITRGLISQNQIQELRNQLQYAQTTISNMTQTQNILHSLGRFVAYPSCGCNTGCGCSGSNTPANNQFYPQAIPYYGNAW